MRKIVISILHYNNDKDTIACLDSLNQITSADLEIRTIVVDNGSREKLDLDPSNYNKIGLDVIYNEKNLGFTGGHNEVYNLIKNSDFDYFLLLNNDCLLEKDSVLKLSETADKDEKIGAVVPKIYFTKDQEFHKDRYSKDEKGKVFWFAGGYMDWNNVFSRHIGVDEVDHGQYDKEEKITFGTGACFLVRKSVLDKIGLFDERYFLYFEDADLNQKIQRAGYKIIYQPKSVIWHNNSGSSGSGSALHDYYLTRNRLLFGMKFAPLKIKFLLMREAIGLLKNGREWQKIGVRDFLTNRFGKGSYKP